MFMFLPFYMFIIALLPPHPSLNSVILLHILILPLFSRLLLHICSILFPVFVFILRLFHVHLSTRFLKCPLESLHVIPHRVNSIHILILLVLAFVFVPIHPLTASHHPWNAFIWLSFSLVD